MSDYDEDPSQQAIPGPLPVPPTRSVHTATEYLAEVVDKDLGTRNGKTALYWHIVYVIQQHAGKKPWA